MAAVAEVRIATAQAQAVTVGPYGYSKPRVLVDDQVIVTVSSNAEPDLTVEVLDDFGRALRYLGAPTTTVVRLVERDGTRVLVAQWEPGPDDRQPPLCDAHGVLLCHTCSANPGACTEEGGGGECFVYVETGMHAHTCRNRREG